jgi:hypothetical protein
VLPSVNDKMKGCICSYGGTSIGTEKLESCRSRCPYAPLSANPIGTALKSNLDSCGDKLANIHPSYRMHLFSGKFTKNGYIYQGCTNFSYI